MPYSNLLAYMQQIQATHLLTASSMNLNLVYLSIINI